MRDSSYPFFDYPFHLPDWVVVTCKLAATHPRIKTPDRIVSVNNGKTTITSDRDFHDFTMAVLHCYKHKEGYRNKAAHDNVERLATWAGNHRDMIDLAKQISPFVDDFYDRRATPEMMLAFFQRAWMRWTPIEDEAAIKEFRSLGSMAHKWPAPPPKRFITADNAVEYDKEDRAGNTWPLDDGNDHPDWEYAVRAAPDGTGVWRIPVRYRGSIQAKGEPS